MTEYQVVPTPTFMANYKQLKKKYRKIDDDFEEFLEEVENGDLGDDIQGAVKNGDKVFKKRMTNSSANKGKSGGFRIIEYLVTKDKKIYLLHMYSKSEKEDISKDELKALIRKIPIKE